ncbi:tetratricopeptide repeat protein [Streptomyces sp. NPDC088757]|uniref:tetratricopeptide repeat protein n=1 Tax=Streptomyces sp. NPDC088757 TaxID=3365889 RepID=UPI0037FD939A
MGGVGKTQLAARFARSAQNSGRTDLLVWVSAVNRDAIELAYAQAARDVCAATEESPRQAAQMFISWLQMTERSCLIILDDVADPADMRGLWPPSRPQCQVVVTTRRRDSALQGQGRELVEVGVFTEKESVSYLVRKLNAHDCRDREDEILNLAVDLGYLPLALAQAASYIADQGLKVSRYRELLADRRRVLSELLPDESSLPDDHEEVLAAVWDLSVARADQLWPEGISRYLLALASVMNPNGIPDAVLTSNPARSYLGICKYLMYEPEWSLEVDVPDLSEEEVLASLRSLHRLSLVSHSPYEKHGMVRVHPLVQRVARESVDDAHQGELAFFASLCILSSWSNNSGERELRHVLRGNIDTLSSVAFDLVWKVEAHEVLFHGADSYGDAGMYATAISQWRRLWETAAEILGPDHPDTLKCLRQIGSWQSKDRDFDSAADTLTQAYSDLLRVKGANHVETLVARGELAQMLGAHGEYEGAARVFEEILECLLASHDPTHILVIGTKCQIAHWQARGGDFEGGIQALEEILAGLPSSIDANGNFACTIRHNLAALRADSGDAIGAIADLEALLEMELLNLGADHPDVLVARHNFAHFHGQVGNRDRAIAEAQAVLILREKIFGVGHPATENTRHLLSRLMSGELDD